VTIAVRMTISICAHWPELLKGAHNAAVIE